MKWGSFIVVTLAVLFIILFEKPRMARYPPKDKLAFAVLLAFGWGVTLLLVLYPEMPGPTDVVEAVFRPLSRFHR